MELGRCCRRLRLAVAYGATLKPMRLAALTVL